MQEHAVYRSPEQCWRCGAFLVLIDPPIGGWRLYCRACRHLTMPRGEALAALARAEAAVGAGADERPLGFVVSVSADLEIRPPAGTAVGS